MNVQTVGVYGSLDSHSEAADPNYVHAVRGVCAIAVSASNARPRYAWNAREVTWNSSNSTQSIGNSLIFERLRLPCWPFFHPKFPTLRHLSSIYQLLEHLCLSR